MSNLENIVYSLASLSTDATSINELALLMTEESEDEYGFTTVDSKQLEQLLEGLNSLDDELDNLYLSCSRLLELREKEAAQ